MTSILLLGAAHVHLDDHLAMAREHGVTVSHVFDRDADRRERWCEALDCEPLESRHALGRTGAAGALVCSETVHHEADISAALEAGLPVYTEKPLAGGGPAARRLALIARREGVPLDTGLFLRTQPALQTLRKTIAEGALGAVHEASARFAHDGGFADWLDVTGWMSDRELAVYGGFGDEAIHALDQLSWLLGSVTGARCQLGRALGLELDDHGVARLQIEGGARAILAGGWTDPYLRLSLEIIGADGWAEVWSGAGGGEARLYARGEADPRWSGAIAPLNAGEGSRGFFEALKAGRTPEPICPPDAAADLNRVLDWCYGR
ncbi:MAG: Gfo/Idh/MocA family oxidoreductase [Oceanicaulis sp.]